MTHEEIVNLAGLVQIDVSKEEAMDLIPKMDSILGYIDQIKSVEINDDSTVKNDADFVLREDIPQDANFKDDFLGQVPNKEDGYVKVIKVLGSE